jgi:hypothetical protein
MRPLCVGGGGGGNQGFLDLCEKTLLLLMKYGRGGSSLPKAEFLREHNPYEQGGKVIAKCELKNMFLYF